MESQEDFFRHLPNEVTQLIFARINDYKTLVQCMSVSRAFRQQAAHVPSLSIVCPGTFSSYDERLCKIFAMVKAFRNLQSLVVRVGQPREEPPSWARCMRYAEIGASVEKFMFMAAKGGDFSELDSTLLGLDGIGRVSTGFDSSAAPLEAVEHRNFDIKDGSESSVKNIGFDRNKGASSDNDIKENGVQRIEGETLLSSVGSNQTQPGKQAHCSRSSPFDSLAKRNSLSHFTLRQVIAPSNDVLKRMLPVIHFAIVQGLNELRDSLPAFVAQFTELRAFLLVDMVESITVFLREHHIQELKLSYLQDLGESPSTVKDAPLVGRHLRQFVLSEDQRKLVKGDMEGEQQVACMVRNSVHSEVLDSRCMNCLQRTGNMLHTDEIIVDEGSSLGQNVEEPQSSSSNRLQTPLFKRYSRERLQAFKGKGKLAEHQEFDSHGECMSSDSNCCQLDVCCSDRSSLANITCPGEGNSIGAYGSPQKDGLFDSEMSQSESLQTYPSDGEPSQESYNCLGPLEAQGSNSNDRSTASEATAEHEHSVDRRLEWEWGESRSKAKVNSYRLQGNKCTRDLKLDLTNKLRRCNKSDTWRKDCMSHRFLTGIRGTGGLFSNNFPDEEVDIQRSRMVVPEDMLDKDEQVFGNEMRSVGDVNDDPTCISNRRGTEHGGNVNGSADECSSSSDRKGLPRDGLQRNDQQVGCGDLAGSSLQALVSETHDNTEEKVVHAETWREPVRRLNGSLCVDRGEELNQTCGDRQLQTSESEAHEGGEPDSWRHMWQDRVRRLRDSLDVDSGQELDRTHESQRERLRNLNLVLTKRHRAMEKDALSFDYTFWRAEQVSSCDYVMSDISMCIATHAARPLGDSEKQVLTQAAIAGPLLVATVSHVNKHYNCHHL